MSLNKGRSTHGLLSIQGAYQQHHLSVGKSSVNAAVSFDVERVTIKDLGVGVEKRKLVGLVIAKYETRSFPDKKQHGQLKYQLSFVLRDSAEYFINVTCWGHEVFIKGLSETFKIGDTVEMCNFMVQTKTTTETDIKYRPSSSSMYQITVNETHSTVSQFSGDDSEFRFISSLPIVDAQDYYALVDIVSYSKNLNGLNVNLMAAIKDVGVTKDIVTKTGRRMKRRELKLFDETCVSFPLIIWDSELSEFADSWQCKETILFLRDVKVSFEDFRQQMVATCTSKTIIITNPDTAEAQHLYSYASSIQLDETFDDVNDEEIMLMNIVDVYNINDLQMKLDNQESNVWQGIIFAVVSSFDIDEDASKCVVTRCSSCNRRLPRYASHCLSENCNDPFQFTVSFEISLSLSDHTNGQSGFMLMRNVAEKVLQMDVVSFNQLSPTQKTELKWKFLMERFKVYFKVNPTKRESSKAFISVLGMEAINSIDFIKNSR
ncbi:meiosis-specific with OB domain-containing protein isoform X3 [Hydra vulgaris]|uniref:Meiosis-specific with OB domain-containing protein isoform X3 n=1 Tax=Hydra vulgaris TaxID=6087 RepID=A0ABM4CEN6_HYDVU